MAFRRIAVVGAGIGGLTAAVALARAGVRCEVFERRTGPDNSGAGLQISPNAAAELHDLGLAGMFGGAVRPVAREIRRWRDDSLLGTTALQGYGAPYYTIRRAKLIRSLLDAVRSAQGVTAVRFGRKCVGLRETGSGVVLHFDDGSESAADAVIGADGLYSMVRARLHRDLPKYHGHVAMRAVVPAAWARTPAALDRVVVWLGPGRHCVAYPIDGGRSLNLVATVPAADPRSAGDIDLPAAYRAWHPAVRDLLALPARFEPHPLYDRPPLPRWHRGRLAVLGDAAHPMLPSLAQGAAQAVEDAVALARCVREPDAFARYQALRDRRARRVADAARTGLRVHHLSDGPDQQRRDHAMAVAPPDSLDWLYGRADVEAGA
jgi:salicylate hydroxylase